MTTPRIPHAAIDKSIERLTNHVLACDACADADHASRLLDEAVTQLRQLRAEHDELMQERNALRDAVLHVADLQLGLRDDYRQVRAFRATANRLSAPFSLARVNALLNEWKTGDERSDHNLWCQSLAADCHDRDEALKELTPVFATTMRERDELRAALVELVNCNESKLLHDSAMWRHMADLVRRQEPTK